MLEAYDEHGVITLDGVLNRFDDSDAPHRRTVRRRLRSLAELGVLEQKGIYDEYRLATERNL